MALPPPRPYLSARACLSARPLRTSMTLPPFVTHGHLPSGSTDTYLAPSSPALPTPSASQMGLRVSRRDSCKHTTSGSSFSSARAAARPRGARPSLGPVAHRLSVATFSAPTASATGSAAAAPSAASSSSSSLSGENGPGCSGGAPTGVPTGDGSGVESSTPTPTIASSARGESHPARLARFAGGARAAAPASSATRSSCEELGSSKRSSPSLPHCSAPPAILSVRQRVRLGGAAAPQRQPASQGPTEGKSQANATRCNLSRS
mmetsp:Transcript_11121/g.34502  ORF Transcript_11121/g.34502 Transcript_11121/m.34502 type:complete len:263 (+) Transcript_11121:1028-1816(+)